MTACFVEVTARRAVPNVHVELTGFSLSVETTVLLTSHRAMPAAAAYLDMASVVPCLLLSPHHIDDDDDDDVYQIFCRNDGDTLPVFVSFSVKQHNALIIIIIIIIVSFVVPRLQ